MKKSDIEKIKEEEYQIFSRPVIYITASVVISLFAAGLYDILVKPGVGYVGRMILNIASLGTDTLKNAAYSVASSDPYPLPTLIILYIISILPLFSYFLLIGMRKRIKVPFSFKEVNEENIMKHIKILGRSIRKYKFLSIFFLIISQSISAVSFNFIYYTITISRVFHTNLNICLPYISNQEERQFLSKFASVKTKNDYVLIDEELKSIAQKNGFKLRDEKVW